MTDDKHSGRGIDVLARRWLVAERVAQAASNAGGTEDRARDAALRYEAAVRAGSLEELLLAWHAARKAQADCAMGTDAWGEARAVSGLVGAEYEARRAVAAPSASQTADDRSIPGVP